MPLIVFRIPPLDAEVGSAEHGAHMPRFGVYLVSGTRWSIEVNVNAFKDSLATLITSPVGNLSPHEKVAVARKVLFEYEKGSGHPESNKGQPWSDDELRVVLAAAPTHENILRLARAFKRGYGSIEQIFRWAGQSEKRIKSARPDDAFVQQILRVRKELGWRSVGGDAT